MRSTARSLVPAAVLVLLGSAGIFMAPEALFLRYVTHPSPLEFAMGIGAFHHRTVVTSGAA